MIYSLLSRHAAVIGAALVLSLTSARAAQAPSEQDVLRDNPAGNYLAARHAGVERDAAAAADYYLKVLKTDPHNADLLSRAFLSVLTDGDVDQAGKLADKVLQVDHTDASRGSWSASAPSSRGNTEWPGRTFRCRSTVR